MAAFPGPYVRASLYVGDLGNDVTESMLHEIFRGIGPVLSVRVCRDAATSRSLGYAYVNYHKPEDADKALEILNFKPIGKNLKQCRVMWAQRDPTSRRSNVGNIFIKGLGKDVDNQTLYDTFSKFGTILSSKVQTSTKGESLGYGFVHFESEESALKAIQGTDQKLVGKTVLAVQQFKSKQERGGGNKDRYTNLFIKNIPREASKEDLDKLFFQYGKITSSVIAKDQENKSKGFAFVNFASHEDALKAVSALNDHQWGEKQVYVARHQNKEERARSRPDRRSTGTNLYIKNLPDNFDDARLLQEFKQFGDITSARVMVAEGHGSPSRGFGFVNFTSQEAATRAINEMNGKRIVGGKPLYVGLHQTKEQRQLVLAQYHQQRMFNMNMYPPNMYFGPQVPRVFVPPQPMMRNRIPWGATPYPRGGQQFHLTPAAAARGGSAGRGRGGRGGRSYRQAQPQEAEPSFKLAENVRNAPSAQAPHVAPAVAIPGPVAQTMMSASEPLTLQALSAAPDSLRKQMIGERLYPLVEAVQPDDASKITGMLLDMDNSELIHLLENEAARSEKIQEAIEVLRKADAEVPKDQ